MQLALFLSWCCCLHGCALGTGFLYQFPASTLQHNYPEQSSGSPGNGFGSRRESTILPFQLLVGVISSQRGIVFVSADGQDSGFLLSTSQWSEEAKHMERECLMKAVQAKVYYERYLFNALVSLHSHTDGLVPGAERLGDGDPEGVPELPLARTLCQLSEEIPIPLLDQVSLISCFQMKTAKNKDDISQSQKAG
ncbi:hypothetical protein WISP_03869 [Willisornis vidua]|uniref:Uncharacterized protein n=1 Tax=Willisornis vidua TaxID=1566151 RepID=A0ABQ9DUR2_9PASS|nr:hypothetical protein WISP_03869 [Willisornis vidua]